MAEEENALALFLKEYSCAQLFAFLLIKHGCTSLIDHGKLLHTLLYLCKDVYGRVDTKELYNRFFKEMDTCDDYHLFRPGCKKLVHGIKQSPPVAVSYRMLRENGKLDGLCELKLETMTRKITFRNGLRVDSSSIKNNTIEEFVERTRIEYHKNGIKARKQTFYRYTRGESHWDSWGNLQCIHVGYSPDNKLRLYMEYNYDYTRSPPLYKNCVEYHLETGAIYIVSQPPNNKRQKII